MAEIPTKTVTRSTGIIRPTPLIHVSGTAGRLPHSPVAGHFGEEQIVSISGRCFQRILFRIYTVNFLTVLGLADRSTFCLLYFRKGQKNRRNDPRTSYGLGG